MCNPEAGEVGLPQTDLRMQGAEILGEDENRKRNSIQSSKLICIG